MDEGANHDRPRTPGGTDEGGGARPGRSLGTLDATILIVGLVVGVGIFRSPQLVAANSASGWVFLSLWGVGGLRL